MPETKEDTMRISEDDFHQLNQLRHRIGFIDSVAQNTHGQITMHSDKMEALFNELHETLEKICINTLRLNE